MNKSKVVIISTVNNFKLYNKSSALYPKDIQAYVIDGRNGMFGIHSINYMMKVFWKKDIEWVVMMDEDALFIDSDLIFPLIDYMEKNNYIVSGVRDGGMLPERSGNPHVINPFFSIINFKKLKQIWNKKEMLKNHYLNKEEFLDDLTGLKYPYNLDSMSEPYYCFYLWLKRRGHKLLYLETSLPLEEDQISNVVHDLEGNSILYHTWFSREYGDQRGRHTARIDKVFKQFENNMNYSLTPVAVYKDFWFPLKERLRKFKKHTRKRLIKIGLISRF